MARPEAGSAWQTRETTPLAAPEGRVPPGRTCHAWCHVPGPRPTHDPRPWRLWAPSGAFSCFSSPSEGKCGRHLGRHVRFAPQGGRRWARAPSPSRFGTPWEGRFGQRPGRFSSSAGRWWWGSRGRLRLAGRVLAVFCHSRRRLAAHSTPPPKSLCLPPLSRAFRSFRGSRPIAAHFTRCAGPISRSLLEAMSNGSRLVGRQKSG